MIMTSNNALCVPPRRFVGVVAAHTGALFVVFVVVIIVAAATDREANGVESIPFICFYIKESCRA